MTPQEKLAIVIQRRAETESPMDRAALELGALAIARCEAEDAYIAAANDEAEAQINENADVAELAERSYHAMNARRAACAAYAKAKEQP